MDPWRLLGVAMTARRTSMQASTLTMGMGNEEIQMVVVVKNDDDESVYSIQVAPRP